MTFTADFMKRLLNRKTIACAVAAAVVVPVISWLAFPPPLEESLIYPGGTVIRDSSGGILRVSLGPGDVDCRPYYKADADDWIVKALVASEDKRFFSHCGVDFRALARAVTQNVVFMRRISGASTISMQTVRLITPHPRTLPWKYAEMFQTIRLELAMNKEEILTQYLNRAPFGSNLIGIESASAGWFGKKTSDLSIGEAALLAGMVQSPSRFRPDRNLSRALKRREYVLLRMKTLGYIDDAQYASAVSAPVTVCRAPRPFAEPFFCDWAVSAVKRHSGDFTTPLDMSVQNKVRRLVGEYSSNGRFSASAVVIRVKTGEVISLVCSGDYFSIDAGQVNTATAVRPAGSALKPFLMALALDRGLVIPSETVADIPRHYDGFSPQNFDPTFRGLVKASDALVLSLNLPFTDMAAKIGVPRFAAVLRTLGFAGMNRPDSEYGLGIATGNAPVSLVELTAAYACLARGGTWTPPAASTCGDYGTFRKVFSPGACWLVSEVLSGHERSESSVGHVADTKSVKFAWKTGTSAAYRDAWTVAWNPEYAVGVWCGHKSGNFGDSRIIGAKAAAPLAWAIARSLYPSGDSPWFAKPDEIVKIRVCPLSGLPVSPDCPESVEADALAGRSSSALCAVHRRDASGNVCVRWPADIENFLNARTNTASVVITAPSDGDVFKIVPGLQGQGVVFRAELPGGGPVWWFANSVPCGSQDASAPFVMKLQPGKHVITCSTAAGNTDTVRISVEEL